ncbi:MAG: D-alanyl-D-alanine carboxypeptidase family protein [Erysipelotrichaceae bacterium]|nr:D-alanyl-D-alanine carboxypeptidase family protein [Erysipelotrichaceae bacterium]
MNRSRKGAAAVLLSAALLAAGCGKVQKPILKDNFLAADSAGEVNLNVLEFEDNKVPDSIVYSQNSGLDQNAAPGKYDVTVEAKFGSSAFEYPVTIEIRDKTNTVVNLGREVELEVNDPRDLQQVLTEVFKEDYPEGTILHFDCEGLDVSVPGRYPAKLSTQNFEEKKVEEFVIVVKEPEENIAAAAAAEVPENPSMPASEAPASVSVEFSSAVETPAAISTEPESAAEIPVSSGLTYIQGIPVINKKYSVPADYAPGNDPTASAAVTQLIADMNAQGYAISYATSGFRSYATQAGLYNGYVAANGQAAADTFSARPGFSEHQSGLAFDLMDASGALLEEPNASQWLLQNCARYGFIVRYQAGKEYITGYMAEPWHLRYIGDQAQAIMDSGLCLEEYLGAEGGDYR